MTASEPAVELRDVIKVYKDGTVETVALRGVSMTVNAGEFVALRGPSGCGKSTLLNLVGGLAVPTAGRVFVGGRTVSDMTEHERAQLRQSQLGLVFQRENLFPKLTSLENIQVPLRLAGRPHSLRSAKELLARVGLSQLASRYPGQLSGGERQRVAVATALALEPKVLLADEPTGELDSRSAEDVLDLLSSLHETRQMTLVLVTHNSDAANRAGRVINMRDGQIASETPA